MAAKANTTWRRGFNRYVPLASVIIGLIVILSSLAVASNPFLTSERRYPALRSEVDRFIGLVRELNRTAIGIGGGPEFEEVTQTMRESLERIEQLAGKES
jgi:hypothetical protein